MPTFTLSVEVGGGSLQLGPIDLPDDVAAVDWTALMGVMKDHELTSQGWAVVDEKLPELDEVGLGLSLKLGDQNIKYVSRLHQWSATKSQEIDGFNRKTSFGLNYRMPVGHPATSVFLHNTLSTPDADLSSMPVNNFQPTLASGVLLNEMGGRLGSRGGGGTSARFESMRPVFDRIAVFVPPTWLQHEISYLYSLGGASAASDDGAVEGAVEGGAAGGDGATNDVEGGAAGGDGMPMPYWEINDGEQNAFGSDGSDGGGVGSGVGPGSEHGSEHGSPLRFADLEFTRAAPSDAPEEVRNAIHRLRLAAAHHNEVAPSFAWVGASAFRRLAQARQHESPTDDEPPADAHP